MNKILIEVSARHVHLSSEHLEKLFGKDYKLHIHKKLSQPGSFSAEEKVTIINNEKRIEDVRILGPLRKETQVEISKTDSIYLEINTPLRISGDLKNTHGIRIKGTKGELILNKGVIVAKRHLHLSEKQAEEMKLKNNDKISIKIEGERGLVFNEVEVRVDRNYNCSFHIDTDEGNAAGMDKDSWGYVI